MLNWPGKYAKQFAATVPDAQRRELEARIADAGRLVQHFDEFHWS